MAVIGTIHGRNGEYEVFHKAPSDTSVYYRDSARVCATGFYKTDSGYTGPDGSAYYDEYSLLRELQDRYDSRRI